MKPRIIKTEQDYEETLAEVGRLTALDPEPGTEDGDALELLAALVSGYESEHFPFSLPDPIDAIVFRMEEQGLKQQDLVPFVGSKSKVSEVLSRKRPLTIAMIRSLHEGLGIPPSILVQEAMPPKERSRTREERFRQFMKQHDGKLSLSGDGPFNSKLEFWQVKQRFSFLLQYHPINRGVTLYFADEKGISLEVAKYRVEKLLNPELHPEKSVSRSQELPTVSPRRPRAAG